MNDLILHRTTGMTLSACSLLLLGLETEGPEAYESCVAIIIKSLF